ncbi:MAG: hypothetical protein JWN82_406 [Candidatus Saccharibacteria bacterium]|nr:hypothetical protein [Candidatus Saccharibacteria bacterium]
MAHKVNMLHSGTIITDMQVELQPGKYVVAVSGGVDSVALLHLLQQISGLQLVVAHFDHGIRPESADDAAFVQELTTTYNLDFMTERAELGAGASEATARKARYKFLHGVRNQTGAQAVITAHHQDDVLETAILNILRGTGRRGLTSLQSTVEIQRPLLHVPKKDILAYAAKQKLSWREDTTNHDERYTRNYIRHRLLVRFDADARQQLLMTLARAQTVNDELDPLLTELLSAHLAQGSLDRQWFTSLPHAAAREVMATWLRQAGPADFDRQTIERLTIQAKVKPAGKRLDVLHGQHLTLEKRSLLLSK